MHTLSRTHFLTHTCAHTHIHVHTHTLSHTHTHTHTHTHIHTYTHIHIHTGHSNHANQDNKTHIAARARTGKGVLLPIHFACDLKNLGPIAGNQGVKQHFQFQRMASVCVWLLERIGGDCAAKAVSYGRTRT